EEQVADRLEVLLRIVGNGLVEELVVGGRFARHHADGVAVGHGLGASTRADVLPAAWAVLNDDGLVPRLLQFVGERAGEHIAASASRERKHEAYRPRWVIVGRCNTAEPKREKRGRD